MLSNAHSSIYEVEECDGLVTKKIIPKQLRISHILCFHQNDILRTYINSISLKTVPREYVIHMRQWYQHANTVSFIINRAFDNEVTFNRCSLHRWRYQVLPGCMGMSYYGGWLICACVAAKSANRFLPFFSYPITRSLPKCNIIHQTPYHIRNSMSGLKCV
jgi:hypothetical protein